MTSFFNGMVSFLTVKVSFLPSYFVFSGYSVCFFIGFYNGVVVLGVVVGFFTNGDLLLAAGV
jgi:hypothetical protein